MEPTSVSATSISTFETCPARYKAENIDRPPRFSGAAADLGTVIHAALQGYVEKTHMTETPLDQRDENEGLLLNLYGQAYHELFGNDMSMYEDGLDQVKNWWERTDFAGRKVLSCETKESFPIPSAKGPVTFNYIWDRCDQLDNGDVEVIDYKSWRIPVSAEKLKDKIQVRCYALAANIKFPDAPRIWVTLDQTRYDAVGAVFTRDDNAATWRYLKGVVQRIHDTPDEAPPEKINGECRFCIRKQVCETLNRFTDAGGVLPILTTRELARRHATLTNQIKTMTVMVNEIEDTLLKHMQNEDILDLDLGQDIVQVTASKRRQVDAERALRIIGPDMAAKFGSITMGNIDKLMKDPSLTSEQRSQLAQMIRVKVGEPAIKVTPKNPIDES